MPQARQAIPSRDLPAVGNWGYGQWAVPQVVPQSTPHPTGVRGPPSSSHDLFIHCLQGIKKPYNPILGETFRCCWFHPQTNSHTFYIAEQARPWPHPGWTV